MHKKKVISYELVILLQKVIIIKMTLALSYWTPEYSIIGCDSRFVFRDGKKDDNAKKLFIGDNYVISARGEFNVKKTQFVELDVYLNEFVSRHKYNCFTEMRLQIINELVNIFENKPFDFQLLIAGVQPKGIGQSYIDFTSSQIKIIDDSSQTNGIRLNQSIYNPVNLWKTDSDFTTTILFDKLLHQFFEIEHLDSSMIFHVPYDRILKILQMFISELGKDDKNYYGIGGVFKYAIISTNGCIIDSNLTL